MESLLNAFRDSRSPQPKQARRTLQLVFKTHGRKIVIGLANASSDISARAAGVFLCAPSTKVALKACRTLERRRAPKRRFARCLGSCIPDPRCCTAARPTDPALGITVTLDATAAPLDHLQPASRRLQSCSLLFPSPLFPSLMFASFLPWPLRKSLQSSNRACIPTGSTPLQRL